MVAAAICAGAEVSVTVRMDPRVKTAIDTIDDDAWTPIEYTDAVFDEHNQIWISRGGGRRDSLHRVRFQEEDRAGPRSAVVRRIPDLNLNLKKRQAPAGPVRYLAFPRLLSPPPP